ncbi:MAG: asparagine synthase-related protein [Victivallaceae bacterium]|nr:asparagine synthase-related protein [Victivallaceae bacterium]
MKIAVGLSGGVDSAVTAALLQAAGHEVVGITMKIWSGDRYRGGEKDACFGPGEADDILRAERLCAQQGIEYHVLIVRRNMKKWFWTISGGNILPDTRRIHASFAMLL